LREQADPDVLKVQLTALARALAPAGRDERPGNPVIVEPEILDVIRILESINPTERPAASPLLDGVWAPIWAKNVPPAWARSLSYFPGRAHFSIQFDLSDPVKPGLYRQRMRIAGLLCADVDGRYLGANIFCRFQGSAQWATRLHPPAPTPTNSPLRLSTSLVVEWVCMRRACACVCVRACVRVRACVCVYLCMRACLCL